MYDKEGCQKIPRLFHHLAGMSCACFWNSCHGGAIPSRVGSFIPLAGPAEGLFYINHKKESNLKSQIKSPPLSPHNEPPVLHLQAPSIHRTTSTCPEMHELRTPNGEKKVNYQHSLPTTTTTTTTSLLRYLPLRNNPHREKQIQQNARNPSRAGTSFPQSARASDHPSQPWEPPMLSTRVLRIGGGMVWYGMVSLAAGMVRMYVFVLIMDGKD